MKAKTKVKALKMTPKQRLMHKFMQYIHYYVMDEIQYEYRQEEEKKKLAAEKKRLAAKKRRLAKKPHP
ncbi:MAG: hypothetical protein LBC64_03155 [Fibromonadaceae bacterium]|jgi:hypothetical protein|nr:hypothetical protein [Fibromonadaceae bacterium]